MAFGYDLINIYPDGTFVDGNLLQFRDDSTGSPTSWAWYLGDGGSCGGMFLSAVQNPSLPNITPYLGLLIPISKVTTEVYLPVTLYINGGASSKLRYIRVVTARVTTVISTEV